MKIHEKYLEALKNSSDWVTVSQWAEKVGELFPDLLAKAEKEAKSQKNETTGLREIAARISSRVATEGFDNIEIDSSERPKKIRYVSCEEKTDHLAQELEDDIAPLKRNEIIKLHSESLTIEEKYRIDEFEAISKLLKLYFGLDFEVDHAIAILNPDKQGKHHPDNLQLLLKTHNGKKNSKNWKRFSLDEQIEYLKSAIKLQEIVASRFSIQLEPNILASLLERLKAVF